MWAMHRSLRIPPNLFLLLLCATFSSAFRNYETVVSPATKEHHKFWQVDVNEFFKKPVPAPFRESMSIFYEKDGYDLDPEDFITMMTAAPSSPGFPRPLWAVLMASIPTGLFWYAYYKFAVEEELLDTEIKQGREPRGLGGYGTLGKLNTAWRRFAFSLNVSLIFDHLFFLDRTFHVWTTLGADCWNPTHTWGNAVVSFVWCILVLFAIFVVRTCEWSLPGWRPEKAITAMVESSVLFPIQHCCRVTPSSFLITILLSAKGTQARKRSCLWHFSIHRGRITHLATVYGNSEAMVLLFPISW